MILLQKHFWRHVPECPAGLLMVIRSLNTSHSEIGDPDIATMIKHEVLRLDVTMDDVLIMQVL
jgi:hypothetical protein